MKHFSSLILLTTNTNEARLDSPSLLVSLQRCIYWDRLCDEMSACKRSEVVLRSSVYAVCWICEHSTHVFGCVKTPNAASLYTGSFLLRRMQEISSVSQIKKENVK